MPEKITVNSQVIEDARRQLMELRSQIQSVRAGTNPTASAHPGGFSLNNVEVRAGTDRFASGLNVKNRVKAIGTQVDTKLAGQDQKLSSYAQGLQHVNSTADSTEQQNVFGANSVKLTP